MKLLNIDKISLIELTKTTDNGIMIYRGEELWNL